MEREISRTSGKSYTNQVRQVREVQRRCGILFMFHVRVVCVIDKFVTCLANTEKFSSVCFIARNSNVDNKTRTRYHSSNDLS